MILSSDFNPDELILREATEEEKIQSWRNNSASWKGKLTVDQYIQQQTINGNQALTRDGRIRYWVYTDGREIYTSAETLQKPAVICARGGVTTKSWTYGVAGVFTVLKFRRRGCASSMMRKLAEWLDGNVVSCDFSVLWSAVGGFYEAFGWSIFTTKEALISAASLLQVPSPSKTAALSREQLTLLCDADVDDVIQRCREFTAHSQHEMQVACLPSFAQAEWHFGSAEYIASQLFDGSDRLLQAKGAMTLEGTTWCYWLHDFNASKLIILRFVYDKSKCVEETRSLIESLGSVLQAARLEAANWGLQQVSMWNPDPWIIKASQDILGVQPTITEEIQGNIPCLRWKNERWRHKITDKVIWQGREMYPWC